MEDSNLIKFPNVQKGYATSIGLLGPHSRLVCSINIHDKTTRYYKTRKQVLQGLLYIGEKVKRWAFHKLKSNMKSNNAHFCADFLPGQLLRGNDKVIPQFLRRLKNQRVESYIKFRWSDKEIPPKLFEKFILIVSKAINKRRKGAFKKIQERRLFFEQIKEESNISENQKMADTSGHSLSRLFFSTPQKSRARSLNVTLIRVNLTPEKYEKSNFTRVTKNARQPKSISIRELEHSSERKQYRFSSADSRWRKIKINHSIHKI